MSGGGDQNTTTEFKPSPQQRAIMKIALPFFRQVGDNPPLPPSGTAYPDFNQWQWQGLGAARRAGNRLTPFVQGVGQGVSSLASGSILSPENNPFLQQDFISGGDITNPQRNRFIAQSPASAGAHLNNRFTQQNFLSSENILRPETNPYLSKYIQAAIRPITEQTTQQLLPQTRSEAIGAGQYGSSRQGIAEGLAMQGAQRAIGDTTANIANTAYGQGLQTMLGRQQLEAGAFANALQNQLGHRGLESQALRDAMDAMIRGQALRHGTFGQSLDAMTRAQGLAPQTAQMQLLPSQVAQQAGNQLYGLQAARQGERYQQRHLAQLWPLLLGQELMGSASMVPGGKNISTAPMPQSNPWSVGLGLGGALLGGWLGGMPGATLGWAGGSGLGGLFGWL